MRIFQILACLASLTLLSGCGGGGSTSTSSSSSSGNSVAVVGVETPSSVSVVTAE